MKVSSRWQQKIAQAQQETTVDLIDGAYTRLRYGLEPVANGLHCRDCATATGQFHVIGCAVERCPRCGGQAIGCLTCISPDEGDDRGEPAEVALQ